MNIEWDSGEITDLIERALHEDLGDGDVTTGVLFQGRRNISAVFLAKQDGILAGLPLVSRIFYRLDPESNTQDLLRDCTSLHPGLIFCRVTGNASAILSGERLALNFLQRLSGIATQTASYVRAAKPYGITILDTRKTTPLLRSLEKYAVTAGGGTNHRFGLYDGVMVKDNHLKLEPDVQKIMKAFEEKGYRAGEVEIEVTSPEMMISAVEAGALWFLLDNMTPDMVRECVRLKTPNMKLEVSGGVNSQNFEQYLIPGVDAISIGGLTHSIKSLDISMEIEG